MFSLQIVYEFNMTCIYKYATRVPLLTCIQLYNSLPVIFQMHRVLEMQVW